MHSPFRVNNIRFRVRGEKSAVCERESIVCSDEICENTWEGGGGGRGGEGAMLVGFVDRRCSLRSVAKTDHSVSTIFY